MILASGHPVFLRYAGNFEQQCQIFEQSLKLTSRLGRLGRLGDIYHLLASLAIWHSVIFHNQPSEKTNRFYLVVQMAKKLETN
jgi:hypothetical protein